MKSIVSAVVAVGAVGVASAASTSMPGSNPCTAGPSFWCASVANANQCGFPVADCSKYCKNSEYKIQDGDICSRPGSKPCTWGPSYWCASTKNAGECDIKADDCKKYCDNAKEYPDIQDGNICNPPGANKCSEGPSFWCASTDNLSECGMKASDCTKYCKNEKEYPDIQDGNVCKPEPALLGADKCTQGPSYWCASQANLKECDLKADDCKKYCKNAKEYPDIQTGDVCKPKPAGDMPGSNKCTYGPSYWCSSKAHAKECSYDIANCKDYCNNEKEYPDLQKGDVCKSLN